MSKFYAIINPVQYSKDIRDFAAQELYVSQEDLDNYITIPQITNILAENSCGTDPEYNNAYVIDDKIHGKIFSAICVWIQNTALAKLAAENLLECAWDENLNEMVFWEKTS